MVFDNYDNPDTFPNIRDFIPGSELGAISVTSRHQDCNAMVVNQSNHFFELFGLEEDAAVALLFQQSQTNEGVSDNAKKKLCKGSRAIHWLSLRLEPISENVNCGFANSWTIISVGKRQV